MSLGGAGNPDDPMSTAVDNAVRAGVSVVIAGGNDGPNEQTINSPGTARGAITVGATYKKDYEGTYWEKRNGGDVNPKTDNITIFSSRGPVIWYNNFFHDIEYQLHKPDIVAPGAFVCAARFGNIFPEGEHPYYKPCIDDKHIQLAGTSMATPIVSGAVALLKQKHPDWTPGEIKRTLKYTAFDVGRDFNTQGSGRIDINKAISAAGPSPIIGDIFSPVSNVSVYRLGDNITIRGSFEGRSQVEVDVFYKISNSNEEWSSLVVLDQDIRPTSYSGLYYFSAKVDTNVLPVSALYDMLVIVKSPDGFEDRAEVNSIYFEKNLKENYPVALDNNLGKIACDDINNNGDKECVSLNSFQDVIPSDSLGNVGSRLFSDYDCPSYTNHPSFGDIDSDKDKEVILATPPGYYRIGNRAGNRIGSIIALDFSVENNSLTNLWEINASLVDFVQGLVNITSSGGFSSAPVVADLDGDNNNEIIALDESGVLHVLEGNGEYREGFPLRLNELLPTLIEGYFMTNRVAAGEPIVGNFDSNVQTLEVAFTLMDHYYFGSEPGRSDTVASTKTILYILDNRGTILDGFPIVFDGELDFQLQIRSQLQLENNLISVDVNNDKIDEIILMTYSLSNITPISHIYAFSSNGRQLWKRDIVGLFSSFIVSDLDKDGEVELIAQDNYIDYFHSNLNIYPKVIIYSTLSGNEICHTSNLGFSGLNIVSADIMGDEDLEILYTKEYNGIDVIDKNCNIIDTKYPNLNNLSNGAMIIKNDKIEILLSNKNYLFSLLTEKENLTENAWPMYQHDPQHTGCYDCDKNVIVPPKPRPQSKLVNNANNTVKGKLSVYLQKLETKGIWVNVSGAGIVNQQIEIPASGVVKLDRMFNARSVSVKSAGKYRAVAEFIDIYGEMHRTEWEFGVSGLPES